MKTKAKKIIDTQLPKPQRHDVEDLKRIAFMLTRGNILTLLTFADFMGFVFDAMREQKGKLIAPSESQEIRADAAYCTKVFVVLTKGLPAEASAMRDVIDVFHTQITRREKREKRGAR